MGQIVAFAPPDQVDAAVERLKPTPGAQDGEQSRLYALVQDRAAQMQARMDSPAAYALKEPSVASAYAAAAKDPALLPDAIGKSLAVTQQAVIDQFRRQIEAEPEWHDGVTSMSGWTREFFGAPGSLSWSPETSGRRPTAR